MKIKHLLLILVFMGAVVASTLFWYFGNDNNEYLWKDGITEKSHNKTVLRGPAGNPFNHPVGVAVDSDGMVFVADSDNHRICIFDSQWRLVKEFGKVGDGEAEFGYPVAVGLNSRGEVFVSEVNNNRIQVLTRSGDFLRWFPKDRTQVKAPTAMHIDNKDQVYVFDKGDQVVKVFDEQGKLLRVVGDTGAPEQRPRFAMGLSTSSGGNLFLADSGNRNIKIYDNKGSLKELLRRSVQGLPPLALPRGLAVIYENKFAIADALSRKVYLVTGSGQNWRHKELEHDFILPDGAAYRDGKLYVTDRGDNSIIIFDNMD